MVILTFKYRLSTCNCRSFASDRSIDATLCTPVGCNTWKSKQRYRHHYLHPPTDDCAPTNHQKPSFVRVLVIERGRFLLEERRRMRVLWCKGRRRLCWEIEGVFFQVLLCCIFCLKIEETCVSSRAARVITISLHMIITE
jgi:hypothetical protein